MSVLPIISRPDEERFATGAQECELDEQARAPQWTEPPVTATATAPAEAVAQLARARRLVAGHFSADDPLVLAALSLIDCATDVVHRLPRGDLESLRCALASARTAVVAATFAVRRVHDLSTVEQA